MLVTETKLVRIIGISRPTMPELFCPPVWRGSGRVRRSFRRFVRVLDADIGCDCSLMRSGGGMGDPLGGPMTGAGTTLYNKRATWQRR
jgi:hypothetical protein